MKSQTLHRGVYKLKIMYPLSPPRLTSKRFSVYSFRMLHGKFVYMYIYRYIDTLGVLQVS